MTALIKFEFIKYLRRKLTVIAMLISLFITGLLFALPGLQFQYVTQDGEIKGFDGISAMKEDYKDQNVSITETLVEENVEEIKTLFADEKNVGYDGNEEFLIGDAYWNHVAPKETLLRLMASNYIPEGEYASYEELRDISKESAENFYAVRNEKIEEILNDSVYNMNEKQKQFWEKRAGQVQKPVAYGYHEGWKILYTCYELMIFAILSICISVAPIFCGEYQAGTDAVILSGKYGKTKLSTAKIIASGLFATFAYVLHVAVAMAAVFVFFGTEGGNLPLQSDGLTIPYAMTQGQLAARTFLVIYIILIALVALTLLISALSKTALSVVSILIPIFFIPVFMSPTGTSGLFNLLMFLMPYRATMPEISKYISFYMFGAVVDLWTLRVCFYAILLIVCIPLARYGFKRHQVA